LKASDFSNVRTFGEQPPSKKLQIEYFPPFLQKKNRHLGLFDGNFNRKYEIKKSLVKVIGR